MSKKCTAFFLIFLFLIGVLPCSTALAQPPAAFEGTHIPSEAWQRDINAGGYIDGSPIGGFGAGTITWRFDGKFYNSRLDIGSSKLDVDEKCGFYMYQKPQGQNSILKKLDAASLGSGQAKYHALFPKAWVDYYGDMFSCTMKVTQFSPIIPEDYERVSYPVGIYKWDITNPSQKPCEVAVMLSWNNNFGGSFAEVVNSGTRKGIVLKRGTGNATEETQGEFTLASEERDGSAVSFSSAVDMDSLISDFSSDGQLNNTVGQNSLGGVCFKVSVEPGQTVSVPIVLSWDIPIAKAGLTGDKWYRKYTRFFGRTGLNSWNIAENALQNYQSWEASIDSWHESILHNPKYPSWFKTALFNELYYYFTGGTYWEAGAASGQPDNPDEDMFTHLETYDYQYYGTSDVRFYGSWPLLMYWPEIDKQCVRQFSDSVYTARTDRPKSIGTTAHDFGTYNNVFRRWNAYTFRNTTEWKDLNAKLVLMIYRDWALTGKNDVEFLNYCWNSIKTAMDKVKSQDSDGDGIPNSSGPDQTYDNMDMKGNTSYNGGLVLAACEAAKEIAFIMGDESKVGEYQEWFDLAKANLEAKLWNGEYYNIDTNSKNPQRVFTDQLCGQWYARACGLPDIISQEHALSSLNKIYENNFKKYYNSSAGVVNVSYPDGTVDTQSQQTKEVWTGVNWALAALMVQYGMLEQAEDIGFSVYSTIYNQRQLWFRTPEAWFNGGEKIRAPYYMRATAIWALKQAYDMYGEIIPTDNIVAGKNVTVSSEELGSTEGRFACDGSLSTRWASQYSDPQWISVDLGDFYNIDRVKLYWETASAKAYKLQISSDGLSWEDVYVTSDGKGGIDNIKIAPRHGRYVRVYCLKRNTSYGYSIWELEAYGQKSPIPSPISQKLVKVCYSSERNPKDTEWYSAPMDITYKLQSQPDLHMSTRQHSSMTTIMVEPSIKYQTMQGIGSSIEESTVYNLSRMSREKREEVLRKLVDPVNGIGMNLMRICFGTSDFTGRLLYTYDDMPSGQTDVELQHFSIQKDIDYNIVSTIQQALAINPELKIFASPWSPPAWMKTTESLKGGSLKREYYEVAARYYRMAVQAYEAMGIPVYAFTIQNEPHANVPTYQTCGFSWEEERDFVQAVKNEFITSGLETKVWILDHNFSMALNFAGKILEDPNAYVAVDGVAFHDYIGEPSEMTKLHDMFPGKEIFLTERSTWGTWGMNRIIDYFRNWACTYNAWVSMLDSSKQPNSGPYKPDPTFAIQDRANYDNYWMIPEYYMLGQFTKFIQFGAKRIYSSPGSISTVTNAAFLNPDNTIVTVVVNQTDSEQILRILTQNEGQFATSIPAKTVATFKWDADIPITPPTMPCTIEAEMYSRASGVDVQECSEGTSNVAWIDEGDWIEYSVNVGTAGKYMVEYRIASNDIDSSIELREGELCLAQTEFAGTGGWQNWRTVADTVVFGAGEHIIRIYNRKNRFNINWIRFTPVKGYPQWFQNFEQEGNFKAGKWSTVSIHNESANYGGTNCIKLAVQGYGDPMSYEKCICAPSQYGIPFDASGQSFFNFFIKEKGANTHRVTIKDTDNQVWSGWVETRSIPNQWTRISLPMSWVRGINKSSIKEIRVGEWNDGEYLIDDMFFSDDCKGDVPAF